MRRESAALIQADGRDRDPKGKGAANLRAAHLSGQSALSRRDPADRVNSRLSANMAGMPAPDGDAARKRELPDGAGAVAVTV